MLYQDHECRNDRRCPAHGVHLPSCSKRDKERAYKSLDGAGLARVDFFVEKETNKIIINEINTLPGFTSISMYPKLWEATGLPYSKLLDKLIDLAMERYKDKQESLASVA